MIAKLPDWLKLLRGDMDNDDDGEVVMSLNAPIGYDKTSGEGISARAFGSAFGSIPKNKKVTLHIASLGGKIDDGVEMANMVMARGGVTCCVTGYAASMGAVIHQAGAKRVMMPGTMLVIHNPQMGVNGEEKDLKQAQDFLKGVKTSLVSMLSKRTGNEPEVISKMMDKTTGMDPELAKKLGFCDEIIEGSPATNFFEFAEFIESLKNGGPGSGPQGGKGNEANEAHSAGAKAYEASAKAERTGKQKDHENARELHKQAAEKSIAAYKSSSGAGEHFDNRAEKHSSMASHHDWYASGGKSGKLHNNLNLDNPEPKKMKNTLTALLSVGLVPVGDMTDEQAGAHLTNSVKEIVTLRDENKKMKEAQKLRIETLVNNAITAKSVKAERKDSLVAMGLRDETELTNYLSDLYEARGQSQPARRGANPAPVKGEEKGTVEEQISELRGKLKGATPSESGAIALELRELRGQKDMFAAKK